jgi:nucleotide sugar dehydrogenase
MKTAAVVGLGKIGLPLAVQYASTGWSVVGADLSSDRVALVNAGQEPFPGEQDLAERLQAEVDGGRLSATTDTEAAVAGAQVVVVVVPLLTDEQGLPDFGALDDATSAIARAMRPGTLVIFETTVPVGTTRRRFTPTLESQSGLAAGREFLVAFSPERVLTGRVFSDLRRYPKIVGGLDEASTAAAADFYESVLEFDPRPDLDRPNGVWDVGSPEAAELTKLMETTYRDVNIALANEFALFAQSTGLDVHQAIAAANSQPYSHVHDPGVSVGGHCIPVYPRLYLATDPDAALVRLARHVNEAMPARVISMLVEAIGDVRGRDVVILGASYRPGVKETSLSGVFPLRDGLLALGANVRVHDPLYARDELLSLGLEPYGRGEAADAIVLHTAHADYRSWRPSDVPGAAVLVDGRNLTSRDAWSGVLHVTLGRGQAAR